jgi:D-alanyl-D-alanine carboxypeptidase
MLGKLFYILAFIFLGLKINPSINVSKTESVSKEALLGKLSPSKDSNFVLVPASYLSYQRKIYLRKEAFQAYDRMYKAALKDGIELKLISGFRSFWHQKSIWEKKWNGKTLVEGKNLHESKISDSLKAISILKYSSMPGTSRHHWGTDIDLINLNNSYFKYGKGQKAYEWLKKNASNFGYCQSYNAKGQSRIQGYEEEKMALELHASSKNFFK